MLNYIWLALVVLAVVIGGCTDNLKEVADKSFEMAKVAVMDTALPLVGIMAMWLGIMRLAERAGLVALLARLLRPLMVRLFPDVPADHPAMGSMLMNMAASMLGLGNAATPLGLRAMKDLETLNRRPGTATNAMCTYLAINTSSIQIIPATAIAILAANNSSNPTAIVGTSIMATTCAAIAAVASAKFLQRLPWYRLPPVEDERPAAAAQPAEAKAGAEKPVIKEASTLVPLSRWGAAVMAAFGLFFVYLFVRLAFPDVLRHFYGELDPAGHLAKALAFLVPKAAPAGVHQTLFVGIVDAVSKISIPFVLSVFPLYAFLRHVKVYEEFVEGAKEGFDVAIRIIPYLVAILVAIGMFRAAGGIDMLSHVLGPVMTALHFPKELLPMVLMRPLSGSGTLGIFAELVKQYGPDTLISRTGGTLYGSTETTFYVLAVYFGSVAVKRTRYAVLAGLTADLTGMIASVFFCWLVFG